MEKIMLLPSIARQRTWMGCRIVVTLCLFAAGASISIAQTTYTAPRGIYTVKIPGIAPGGPPVRTYLGIQLLPDTTFVGLVASVSGNSVSFQNLTDYQSLQNADRKSYLQVLEGPGEGFISDVETFNLNNITCADNLSPWISSPGMSGQGTRVFLRPHSNLSDILGVSNSFGLGPATEADLADNVVIFDPTSQQERVYYFNSTRTRWEQKRIVADAAKAIMRYPYGLYIVRRTPGTLRLALSGDVASQSVLLPVSSGANVFSLPVNLSASVSEWISSSGPFSIFKGINTETADLLMFQEPTTANQRGPFYFRSQLGAEGWRKVGINGSNEASQSLDFLSTLILQRDGPPGYLFAKGSIEPGPPISLPPDPEPGEVPLIGELKGPRAMLPDTSFAVEISTDLQTWTIFANSNELTQLPNGRLRFTLPSGQKRAFYRLKVTLRNF